MPYKDKEGAFWSKVCKSNIPDGCWVWTRSLTEDGYGHCLYLGEQLAHRVAYRLLVGEIPVSMCVLHTCDNRCCTNPEHLFLGTRLDNNKDRDQKGRGAVGNRHGSRTKPEARPRGEQHSNAKLSDAEVVDVRVMYAKGGVTHRSLAKLFGVSHATIGDIVRYETRMGDYYDG